MRKPARGRCRWKVSSHGLVQGRVNGVRFACGPVHQSLARYLDYTVRCRLRRCKARLFESRLETAVLKLDDEFGRRWRSARRPGAHRFGYSSRRVKRSSTKSSCRMRSAPAGARRLQRVDRASACSVASSARGVSAARGSELLARLPPVPGACSALRRALVVVDYAHTPDALEKVLQALRPVRGRARRQARGRVRRGRRPRSIEARADGRRGGALRRSRHGQSDNPRNEDPAAIISQIEKGISGKREVEADRPAPFAAVIAAAARTTSC